MASTTVEQITIGRRHWGARPGACHALRLAGVDGAEVLDELDALLERLVEALRARVGGVCEVVAPRPPATPSWWTRLRAFGPHHAAASLNPLEVAPAAALALAARRADALAFARVEYGGDRPQPPAAFAFTSDGQAIVWVWLAAGVDDVWPELVERAAGSLPTRATTDSATPTPANLRLTETLPRVGLHRGESATWTDGERRLSFLAGLGVTPPEVYLPSAAAWPARAPEWASDRWAEIVADFQAAGVRVVERDDGWVGAE